MGTSNLPEKREERGGGWKENQIKSGRSHAMRMGVRLCECIRLCNELFRTVNCVINSRHRFTLADVTLG